MSERAVDGSLRAFSPGDDGTHRIRRLFVVDVVVAVAGFLGTLTVLLIAGIVLSAVADLT